MIVRGRRAAGLFSALLVLACAGDAHRSQDQNAPPVARITATSSVVRVGSAALLDGSTSSDPDGDGLTYAWAFGAKPGGSAATLAFTTGKQTAFVPDLPGAYVVTLVVSDGKVPGEPAMIVLTATTDGGGGGGGTDLPPVANAGGNRSAFIGVQVTLDGTGSFDPESEPLRFSWRIVSAPAGSTASLGAATTATPTFTPDRSGSYVVELTVSDAAATAIATVVITATNPAPAASPGGDRAAYVGDLVALDARAADPDGEPITYAWTLPTRPAGSAAALVGADTATPSLHLDVAGTYLVALAVSDPSATADTITFTITAYPPLAPLTHRVLDAEYSKALDAIVMIDEAPSALYVYDPVAKTESRVLLPLTPTSVSVGPDGLFAVVGHNANVSYVDLAAARLVKTYPVSAVLGDVVLAGNGFAYLFPTTPSFDTIHSLNLSTGAETSGGGFLGFEGTRAKLHPGGAWVYGADNGVSPADIRKFDVSAGASVTGYDSPYHGDYSMCGNLWLSEDGARIFTACGNVFRATSTRTTDMTYAGALEATGVVRDLADSQTAAEILAIPGTSWWSGTGHEDESVRVFGAEYMTQKRAVALSPFLVGEKTFAGHGRFVFWSADASRRFALVQADPTAGLLKDFAAVEF